MHNYSNIKLATAGFLALAVSVLSGCRSGPQFNTNNPYINDTVPVSSYSLKTAPSGAPVIVQSNTAETPLFSEPAEGSYENKNINIIVRGQNKKIVTGDISSKLELGEKFQEVRTGAKLIIKPTESCRIVPEIQGIAARKVYSNGSAAETEGLIAGLRGGVYTNIGQFIGGAAKDLTVYLEGRLHGEMGQYAGRTKEKHMAALAGIGLGLFSGETGTYLRAILEGGTGNYEMDLTSISDEEKERIGLDPTVDRVNGSLNRFIGDFQAKKTVVDPLYVKSRLSFSLQDRKNWNDYFAIASEVGVGLEGELSDILKRCFVDFMLTHRNESNDYFNKTSKHKNIMGARIGVGAQIGNSNVVKLAVEWDEELMLRVIAKWTIRF